MTSGEFTAQLLTSGLYRWHRDSTDSCLSIDKLAGYTASRRNYRRPEAVYIVIIIMKTASVVTRPSCV
jgi:hypothetical protein